MRRNSLFNKTVALTLVATISSTSLISAAQSVDDNTRRNPRSVDQVKLPIDLFPIDAVTMSNTTASNCNPVLFANNVGTGNNNGNGATSGASAGNNTGNCAPVAIIPNSPQTNPANNPNKQGQTNTNTAGQTNIQTVNMPIATITNSDFNCPIFKNDAVSSLFDAIDALNKVIVSAPDCKNDTSAADVQANTKTLIDSVNAIKQMSTAASPTQVDLGQIETTVTNAIKATEGIGNTLSSNGFLNSSCGKSTMSTGKVLLALNDILNGLEPYALMAVSLNAALAPALPFVIGTAAVTSGISIVEKISEQNTINMDDPTMRKAVIQNTCQFIKVSQKYRFLELAKSGQIDRITNELDKNIQMYKSRFSLPSTQLVAQFKFKSNVERQLSDNKAQLALDKTELDNLNQDIATNNDDIMVCTLARELVNAASDNKSFPTSVFKNLEATNGEVSNGSKVLVSSLSSVNQLSMKKIVAYADKISSSESALKACASTAHNWVNSINQAHALTKKMIDTELNDVESELNKDPNYKTWQAQYNFIKIEQLTATRVENALSILSKDDSMIDRSELAQRLYVLRKGLFGSADFKISFLAGAPPVLAWLNHTDDMFNRASADFKATWLNLRNGSVSINKDGKLPFVVASPGPMAVPVVSQQVLDQQARVMTEANNLGNFNLTNLPLGSRQNEIACQQLESAWLSWTAAIDHLGAQQLFCNMIDNLLDSNIDPNIVYFCRGKVDLAGNVITQSSIERAKSTLISLGYQQKAQTISARIKDLQCPMPGISTMIDQ